MDEGMGRSVFLAGGAGAIGRRLVPLLVAANWRVVATTRSAEKAALLAAMGAEPAVLDVYDAEATMAALLAAKPTIVIHQLTDLPQTIDRETLAGALHRNARLREVGTRHLVAAAVAAGAKRLIAQSIAFAYAAGVVPHHEGDPLAVDLPGDAGISGRGVESLERQVLSAPVHGIVLRYGRIYGPGTGRDVAVGAAPVHVDAAAKAAALAMASSDTGVFNLAEDDGTVSSERAKRCLGWDAKWRAAL